MAYDRAALVRALSAAYNGMEQKREALLLCERAGIDLFSINHDQSVQGIFDEVTRVHAAKIPKLVECALADARKARHHEAIRAACKPKASALPRHPAANAYLRLDRHDIWSDLQSRSANDPRAHALLLCGAPEDGHQYFLNRVRAFEDDLGARALPVDSTVFNLRDARKALLALRDVLARELGEDVAVDALPDAIARLTEDRSLILIYPTYPEALDAAHARWLKAHHTDAIPELYRQAVERRGGAGGGALITLQPIVWRPRLWDWIEALSAHRVTHGALAPLEPQATRHELKRIERSDIEMFFRELYSGHPDAIDAATSRGLKLYEASDDAQSFFARLQELLSAADAAQR
ncbi:hypothetical protein SCE1572_24850 [Sorangium cellulosum So0157-2]|uniref:Uncharacterized protein n=2 Tax=Sorangium cellulosum TaxID=56 RepID=S4XZW1_SORCE|nr:hypothetical protein SCE1572_24850 [Sorangium cellulosum So0157-2]